MDVENIAASELEARELGFWVARWRGFCGHTLKEVEHATGIPAVRLSRVEAGEGALTPSERFVLLDYLGVEVRKIVEVTNGRIFFPAPAEDLHQRKESNSQSGMVLLAPAGQA